MLPSVHLLCIFKASCFLCTCSFSDSGCSAYLKYIFQLLLLCYCRNFQPNREGGNSTGEKTKNTLEKENKTRKQTDMSYRYKVSTGDVLHILKFCSVPNLNSQMNIPLNTHSWVLPLLFCVCKVLIQQFFIVTAINKFFKRRNKKQLTNQPKNKIPNTCFRC